MKSKLNSIMLIDDNNDDNFFHEREIKKNNVKTSVIVKKSGLDALGYLKSKQVTKESPLNLIFLDINMPGMNGWEFLEEYSRLDKKLKSEIMIIMLTTSDNSDDEARAKKMDVITDYITKPLTKEKMKNIDEKYFGNNSI